MGTDQFSTYHVEDGLEQYGPSLSLMTTCTGRSSPLLHSPLHRLLTLSWSLCISFCVLWTHNSIKSNAKKQKPTNPQDFSPHFLHQYTAVPHWMKGPNQSRRPVGRKTLLIIWTCKIKIVLIIRRYEPWADRSLAAGSSSLPFIWNSFPFSAVLDLHRTLQQYFCYCWWCPGPAVKMISSPEGLRLLIPHHKFCADLPVFKGQPHIWVPVGFICWLIRRVDHF